jgi:hypothetical protein
MRKLGCLSHLLLTVAALLQDALRFTTLALRSRSALMAENLLLRKQLALYLEREVRPRRTSAATKLTLAWLSRLLAWRNALTIVKPETFLRWHRQGFRLFWRWKSKPRGRPHSSLGPGIPEPTVSIPVKRPCGHRIRDGHRVVSKPVLGAFTTNAD